MLAFLEFFLKLLLALAHLLLSPGLFGSLLLGLLLGTFLHLLTGLLHLGGAFLCLLTGLFHLRGAGFLLLSGPLLHLLLLLLLGATSGFHLGLACGFRLTLTFRHLGLLLGGLDLSLPLFLCLTKLFLLGLTGGFHLGNTLLLGLLGFLIPAGGVLLHFGSRFLRLALLLLHLGIALAGLLFRGLAKSLSRLGAGLLLLFLERLLALFRRHTGLFLLLTKAIGQGTAGLFRNRFSRLSGGTIRHFLTTLFRLGLGLVLLVLKLL
ncbi:MAG: hypothetical protein CFE26_17280, partial [Verrucomicrobiales bacterium VVV1]